MDVKICPKTINTVLSENIADMNFIIVKGLLESLSSEGVSNIDIFFNFLKDDMFYENEDGYLTLDMPYRTDEAELEKIIEDYFFKFVEKLIEFDSLIVNITYNLRKRDKIYNLGYMGDDKGYFIGYTNKYINQRDEVMKNFLTFLSFFRLNVPRYTTRYQQIKKEELEYFTMSRDFFKADKYRNNGVIEEPKVEEEIEVNSSNERTIDWDDYIIQSCKNKYKMIHRIPGAQRGYSMNCIIDPKGRIYECPCGHHGALIEILVKNKLVRIKNPNFLRQEILAQGWCYISENFLYVERDFNRRQAEGLYNFMAMSKGDFVGNLMWSDKPYEDAFVLYDDLSGSL